MIPALIAGPLGFLVGSSYPAFHSFKAVKAKDDEQYHRWMKYWIIFSGFQSVAMVTDMFCSWVPFYQEIKLGFTVWLALFQGSDKIYHQFVAPFLDDYEPIIDKTVDQFTADMKKRASQIGAQGYETIQNAMLDTFDKATSCERSSSTNLTEPSPQNKVSGIDDDKFTEVAKNGPSGGFFKWPSILSTAPVSANAHRATHTNSRYSMPRPGAASSSAVSVDKKPAATDTPTATSATWWRYTGLSSAFASTPNTSEPKVTNAPSPARTLETAVSDTGTVPVCDTEPAAVERALQARGAGQGWLSGWGYRTGKPSVKLD